MINSNRQSDHPLNLERVALVWGALQGKWTIHILCEMLTGPVRLSDLRRKIPRASKKALTASLKALQAGDFIRRRDLSGKILHVEYELSDSAHGLAVALLNLLNRFEGNSAGLESLAIVQEPS